MTTTRAETVSPESGQRAVAEAKDEALMECHRTLKELTDALNYDPGKDAVIQRGIDAVKGFGRACNDFLQSIKDIYDSLDGLYKMAYRQSRRIEAMEQRVAFLEKRLAGKDALCAKCGKREAFVPDTAAEDRAATRAA